MKKEVLQKQLDKKIETVMDVNSSEITLQQVELETIAILTEYYNAAAINNFQTKKDKNMKASYARLKHILNAVKRVENKSDKMKVNRRFHKVIKTLAYICLLLLMVLGITSCESNTQSTPVDGEKTFTLRIIKYLQNREIDSLANCFIYPIARTRPLSDISNKNEFKLQYDTLFDQQFIDDVSKNEELLNNVINVTADSAQYLIESLDYYSESALLKQEWLSAKINALFLALDLDNRIYAGSNGKYTICISSGDSDYNLACWDSSQQLSTTPKYYMTGGSSLDWAIGDLFYFTTDSGLIFLVKQYHGHFSLSIIKNGIPEQLGGFFKEIPSLENNNINL